MQSEIHIKQSVNFTTPTFASSERYYLSYFSILLEIENIHNFVSDKGIVENVSFVQRVISIDLCLATNFQKTPVRLTDSPTQDIRPVLSPDGQQIAFTSTRNGNHEIYVMKLDGTDVRQVTNHPERDDYPSWHPQGNQLLFVSERGGRFDLYACDLATLAK